MENIGCTGKILSVRVNIIDMFSKQSSSYDDDPSKYSGLYECIIADSFHF